MENVIVSEEKKKPAYDEQTLAKLLEAAYVLQEHSEELRMLEAQLGLTRGEGRQTENVSPRVNSQASPTQVLPDQHLQSTSGKESLTSSFDSNDALAQIADLQHQIELRGLGLNDALESIAKQLLEISGAAGAAIGICSGEQLSYRAVAGIGAPQVSSTVQRERTCSFPSLRGGQVFRCSDVSAEPLIDPQECSRRGIASFIAAPVFGDNSIAGAVELYFSDPQGFTEQDVQTCQLMAGIVTDVLSRESKPVDSNTEMSALLEHLSKLEPGRPLNSFPSVRCYKCGHELMGEEQFCGQCGAARSHDGEPLSMQSKVASLWHMKQSNGSDGASDAEATSPGNMVDSSTLAAEVPINVRALQEAVIDPSPGGEVTENTPLQTQEASAKQDPFELSVSDSASSVDWSSAISAREYLEQVAGGARRSWLATLWQDRRGDIYLAIAIILVVSVLRWGLWNNHPVNATSANSGTAALHKTVTPELSLFDRILIHLGLAEAPPIPEDKGNPAIPVWVDLQTGLYYCPATDLYGKTPKGKYTSQRDAQLDQFAPAYRKVCD